MRILFLDDDPQRQKKFQREMIGNIITFTETPELAVEALERRSRFDIVSLDHDLYGKVYQPSDEKSGFAVCQFLRKLESEKLPDKVICHSYNEQGVKNMMHELEPLEISSYAEPFDLPEYWEHFAAESVTA